MHLQIPAVLILFLSYFPAFCQDSPPPYSDTGEVPFKLIKNTIIIPVSIDGKVYDFVFDTGGFLSISPHIQKTSKLPATDSILVSDANGYDQYFDMTNLPQVKIGNLTFENRQALVIYGNDHYPENCFGADGMIGRDFFEDLIIQLDYQGRTLRMSNDPGVFKMDNRHRAKMRTSKRGIPDVLLTLNGKEQFVEFDSGSGDFFSYKTKTAKRLKGIPKTQKLRFDGIFSYGVSSKAKVRSTTRYRPKVNALRLGATQFTDFYSDFSKNTKPRIGASILYYGKVTLDFQNMWFYFEPYLDKPKLPSLETFGFDIVYLNKEYLIKWVLQGSQAEKEGLTYGLKVKSINDQSVDTLAGDPCRGYIHGYGFQLKEEVELAFLDAKGHLKKVKLKKTVY